MSRQALVIDAGVGNLGNLVRALEHVGGQDGVTAEITADPARVAAGRCLFLPGVGAFAPPREALRGAMEEAIRSALESGAFLLGICVGYQILFESGEEFQPLDGLGLLPGKVTRLPQDVQVPHIGWNRLHDLAAHPLVAGLGAMASSVGEGLAPSRVGGKVLSSPPAPPPAREGASPSPTFQLAGEYVYFVHSYAPEGVPDDLCIARCTHGRVFPAVAGRGRVMGTQFHPERSGEAGLRLLANFLEMADGSAAGH